MFTVYVPVVFTSLLQPPLICWFQGAIYQLKLLDTLTRVQVPPNRQGTYRGDEIPTVSESYEVGIEKEKDYEAVVVIESLTGTTNTTIQFSTFYHLSFPTCSHFIRFPFQTQV